MSTSAETKDNVAKVGFMAFMAAAMGPVGIFIAALSVGISEAMDGDAGRVVSQDVDRDRVEEQRQWLAEDRAFRARLRADRQRWLDDGADPTTRPAGPSKAEAVGRWWRRLYARMVVFSDDFTRGFRDGWAAAKDARDRGADWLETARTRPDNDVDDFEADDLDWSESGEPEQDTEPDEQPDVDDISSPDDEPPPRPEPTADVIDLPKAKATDDRTEPEGEDTMAAQAASDNTNLDVAKRHLDGLQAFLGSIDDKLDALEKERQRWRKEIEAAKEHAASTGAPTAVIQALDAALSVVAQMGAHLSAFASGTQGASEQLNAASGGLAPAEQIKDNADQIGMRGGFVDRAAAA